jgi:isopenicillin-N epimerase
MKTPTKSSPVSLMDHWPLEAGVSFLNHGSFGACPHVVLAAQDEWRAQLESSPVRFLHRELEPLLDGARVRLAQVLGADVEGLALVANATTGVNTAMAALTGQTTATDGSSTSPLIGAGDEILILDPEYNATANAVKEAAQRVGAVVTVVPIPFPIQGPEVVTERVLAAVTDRTRLLVIDHIVSQTGLVLPLESLIGPLRERGIETLVDGAHGPGHIALKLDELGAAFYTGNCHKWLCTPKGSAMLQVREDWRARTRPLVISHGANTERTDRSKFHIEFDWPGTFDPTPFLTIPVAIDFLEGLFPGGLTELQERNRNLAIGAQATLAEALEIDKPAPTSMIGCLASLPLPPEHRAYDKRYGLMPLHLWLAEERGVEVPVFPFPALPNQVLRVSAHAYNTADEYEALGKLLQEWFAS